MSKPISDKPLRPMMRKSYDAFQETCRAMREAMAKFATAFSEPQAAAPPARPKTRRARRRKSGKAARRPS